MKACDCAACTAFRHANGRAKTVGPWGKYVKGDDAEILPCSVCARVRVVVKHYETGGCWDVEGEHVMAVLDGEEEESGWVETMAEEVRRRERG